MQCNKYTVGDSESPISSSKGLQIGLTNQQFLSFQALLQALSSQSKTAPSELNSLVDAALRSIYMPTNSLYMFENIFRNPSTIYVILRSIQAQGGFANPKDLTVHYAHIQFGIRLTIMADVQKQHLCLQTALEGNECDSKESYKQLME
ncbi:hypothetical protein J3R83DRAFT_9046 [Lanmaoa asiatica]|nr:hypothetical protein J3R83DRAFT_9046 [Lanmaoa asiatica]